MDIDINSRNPLVADFARLESSIEATVTYINGLEGVISALEKFISGHGSYEPHPNYKNMSDLGQIVRGITKENDVVQASDSKSNFQMPDFQGGFRDIG